MYPSHLSNYVINESQSLAEGYWKLGRQLDGLGPILVVLNDKDGQFAGVVTGNDFLNCKYIEDGLSITVGEICVRNTNMCDYSSDIMEVYKQAMVFFIKQNSINAIPVIDDSGKLRDIVFRKQVFYLDYYKKCELPRMFYARAILSAAHLAKRLSMESFSVMEFGVAGGNGLVNCEFHAKAISRLLDIDIQVYGFDTGVGLPNSNDYRDMLYVFREGFFTMDLDRLKSRLEFAQIIIGDIRETAKSFIANHTFAPIGTMLIDVDMYTSTVPILNMLQSDTKNFLPRVSMYFDDIAPNHEHEGEILAINEFNESNEFIKISRTTAPDAFPPSYKPHYQFCANLFKHEKYNIDLGLYSETDAKLW